MDSHGYSIVELDSEELRFEWWTVEGLDTRSPGQELAASMAVRHGEPRLIGKGALAGGAAKPRAAKPKPKPIAKAKSSAQPKPASKARPPSKPGPSDVGAKPTPVAKRRASKPKPSG
jgi:hypothetical protein